MYTTVINFVISFFTGKKESENGYDVKFVIGILLFLFVGLPIIYFTYSTIKDGFNSIFNIKTDKEIIVEKNNEISTLQKYNNAMQDIVKKEKKINEVNSETIVKYFKEQNDIRTKEEDIVKKVFHPPDNVSKVKIKTKVKKIIKKDKIDITKDIVIDKKEYMEEGSKNIDLLWEMYNDVEGDKNEE